MKCETPCYTLTQVTIEVKNIFPSDGEFRIVLVESKAMQTDEMMGGGSKRRVLKSVTSKTDHGQNKSDTSVAPKTKESKAEEKARPALLQQLQEGGIRHVTCCLATRFIKLQKCLP